MLMALVNQWRRDLSIAEKRVNFKQLEEFWNTAENDFIEATLPIIGKIIDKMLADIKWILESNDLSLLKDLKLGYKDKLVNIVRQKMADSYRMGKAEAQKELQINKEAEIDEKSKEYFNVKAEAVVSGILDKMRNTAIYLTLAGVRAKKPVDQILADINGPKYEEAVNAGINS
jgi:hypothetical protein